MDEYIQEILDVLWEIEGWHKDEMRNRVRVRKWLKEFPPEQVDLIKLARKFDAWTEGKGIKNPNVSTFDSYIRTLSRKGDVEPFRLTINGAVESVEEQLRQKDLKRKADLRRLGLDN